MRSAKPAQSRRATVALILSRLGRLALKAPLSPLCLLCFSSLNATVARGVELVLANGRRALLQMSRSTALALGLV